MEAIGYLSKRILGRIYCLEIWDHQVDLGNFNGFALDWIPSGSENSMIGIFEVLFRRRKEQAKVVIGKEATVTHINLKQGMFGSLHDVCFGFEFRLIMEQYCFHLDSSQLQTSLLDVNIRCYLLNRRASRPLVFHFFIWTHECYGNAKVSSWMSWVVFLFHIVLYLL